MRKLFIRKRNEKVSSCFHPADLMIEMEDHTNDQSEGRIPFLDYKTYTDRVFFLPSKDGANDVMITGKLNIPEDRRAVVTQALNQFSNLLNSKTFLLNVIILHMHATMNGWLWSHTGNICIHMVYRKDVQHNKFLKQIMPDSFKTHSVFYSFFSARLREGL